MKKFSHIFLLLLIYTSTSFSQTISVMSINAQNLFDTLDDFNKDDKAFLPIELKQSENHNN